MPDKQKEESFKLKISKKDQSPVQVFDGVVRKTLACGRDILMARFEYKKGSKVPIHKHSYEQVTTVLKGKQKIIIQDKEIIVSAGDSYIVPCDFEHEQISLEDSVTIDSWSLAP
ncbi:MAG: cupin domain-containing protein [Candidatus Aminicenantes bacterium]|nr:cupin domain-containing protein [Candidatus Aminicenantes bacterium]